MALTLGDLLIRRTHLAFETADQARSLASDIAKQVQPLLGWSHRERDAALEDYDREIAAVFGIAEA
jgi:glycerol-3-phosphate dehydrogenase